MTALSTFKGRGTPFQEFGFVGAWATTRARALGRETIVLVAEDDRGISLMLPLEIIRRGPFRIAAFPGETHANANGPLRRAATEAETTSSVYGHTLPIDAMARAIAEAGGRIDALDLRRVPDPSFVGTGARIEPAFEKRFAVSLEGGFAAVLARGNAKRKRKKFRSQQRHFEPQGGAFFRDVPRNERGDVLKVFLAQKRERFAELKMPDPFSDIGIDAFLRSLFEDENTDARLYVVESGGIVKALIGGIVSGDTFFGMFSSFANDADAVASPGELLLWHLAETLCAEGHSWLDLGTGEERYKLSWCDRIVVQYDVLVPLGPRGRIYAALASTARRGASFVKGNKRLRSIAQRARRLLSRRLQPAR